MVAEYHKGLRKRIWEVDCWSLDAAIAASFDWRDLVNMLQGQESGAALTADESLLELQAQCLIHECCHSENDISVRVENLLNAWHQTIIRQLACKSPCQIAECIFTMPFERREAYGGLCWALGSDPRAGLDCLCRRLHQRFQVFSIRHAMNKVQGNTE